MQFIESQNYQFIDDIEVINPQFIDASFTQIINKHIDDYTVIEISFYDELARNNISLDLTSD
jgi:hypothetical protein